MAIPVCVDEDVKNSQDAQGWDRFTRARLGRIQILGLWGTFGTG